MTAEQPKRLLIVAAHPDDAEFGCGGTVAKWVREGWEALLVMCTDGGKGSSDPEMSPARLKVIREGEQREAARILGIGEVIFLGYPDGELEDTRDLRREVVREVRRFKPDIVFCPDPYRHSHNHRDHRVAGQVALDAVYPYARDIHHFPELAAQGFLPHIVGEVYTWSDEPDTYVDVGETLDVKFEALRAHKSQMRNPEGLAERFRQRYAEEGKKAGFPYAEGFRRYQFRFPGAPPAQPPPR